jgi:hypothetical protein
MGGAIVVDFTDPANPVEVAFYDIAPPGPAGSDHWSAYWYGGPKLGGDSLTLYASDGVHDPAAVRQPVGASTCSTSMACLPG